MFVTITPFRHLSIHHKNNMLSTNINWLNPLLMCLHKYPWKIWKKLPFLFAKVMCCVFFPIAFVDFLQLQPGVYQIYGCRESQIFPTKKTTKKHNRGAQHIYGWTPTEPLVPTNNWCMVQVCGGLFFLEDKRKDNWNGYNLGNSNWAVLIMMSKCAMDDHFPY